MQNDASSLAHSCILLAICLTRYCDTFPCARCVRHISPGQEEGNVPFVENAGFGTYSGDPQVIAETVRGWLASPATMSQLQNAALNAARPSATLDIAKDMADMVFKAKQRKTTQPELVRVSRKSA